jgi:hypothetical protein
VDCFHRGSDVCSSRPWYVWGHPSRVEAGARSEGGVVEEGFPTSGACRSVATIPHPAGVEGCEAKLSGDRDYSEVGLRSVRALLRDVPLERARSSSSRRTERTRRRVAFCVRCAWRDGG